MRAGGGGEVSGWRDGQMDGQRRGRLTAERCSDQRNKTYILIGAGRKERKGVIAGLQKESAGFVSGSATSESSATIKGGRSPHVAVYQVPRA